MKEEKKHSQLEPRVVLPASIISGSNTFQRIGRVLLLTGATFVILLAFAGMLKLGKVMVNDVKGMGL